LDTQRLAILDYAQKHGLVIDTFVESQSSSRRTMGERGLRAVLDVHFINSLPVKQRPACTVWADKRPAQIV